MCFRWSQFTAKKKLAFVLKSFPLLSGLGNSENSYSDLKPKKNLENIGTIFIILQSIAKLQDCAFA